MSKPHWSSSHLSAYIRPRVSERSTDYAPHHKQIFTLSLHSVTDQNPQGHKKPQEPSWNPSTIQSNFAPNSHKFFEFIIKFNSQRQTEATLQANSMEFHTVLRDSEWIFIIEPEHLQFEHEHATGSSALQVWSQHSNWKRRRGRSEGFHRFEPEEERESEIALPVKIQSQGSKETVQILEQDSGNTQIHLISLRIITSPELCESITNSSCSDPKL